MAGRSPARVGGPVEVFKNLSPKVSGYQRAECAGGRVSDEVKVANLLCDDAQTRAGAQGLYLWAKDLAEGHILQIRSRGAPSAMAAQTRAVPAGATAGWDSASPTTFDIPGTYTSWFVYSEMNK